MPDEPDLYGYAGQTCELDLHGYAVSATREVAKEFVKAAWEAGHDHVVLIHGARAARPPRSELVLNGYGGMKVEFACDAARWRVRPHARSPRSPMHRLDATRLIVALEPHQPR
jgi:hypothetical protein